MTKSCATCERMFVPGGNVQLSNGQTVEATETCPDCIQKLDRLMGIRIQGEHRQPFLYTVQAT
ncbi:hypothetical protein ACFL2B_03155 [Patescibacteria group bacterium]